MKPTAVLLILSSLLLATGCAARNRQPQAPARYMVQPADIKITPVPPCYYYPATDKLVCAAWKATFTKYSYSKEKP